MEPILRAKLKWPGTLTGKCRYFFEHMSIHDDF